MANPEPQTNPDAAARSILSTIRRELPLLTALVLLAGGCLGLYLQLRDASRSIDAQGLVLAEIRQEQAAGKERSDKRQAEITQEMADTKAETARYIDTKVENAVSTGRAAREALESRVRATEMAIAGIGPQLSGISADVREIRGILRAGAQDQEDKP